MRLTAKHADHGVSANLGYEEKAPIVITVVI